MMTNDMYADDKIFITEDKNIQAKNEICFSITVHLWFLMISVFVFFTLQLFHYL